MSDCPPYIANAAAGAEAAVAFHVLVFFIPVVVVGAISLPLSDIDLAYMRRPKRVPDPSGSGS
ncbi:MAG: hypothetical protein OEM97_00980 [Acidimicrobiia bacterium]|nr:hypothetical protein [Acidimicrobiia bacterium]